MWAFCCYTIFLNSYNIIFVENSPTHFRLDNKNSRILFLFFFLKKIFKTGITKKIRFCNQKLRKKKLKVNCKTAPDYIR